MLIVLARTLILFAFVVLVMRIMGKRQIGELQPFELVVAIMISELAAIPMQNTGVPLVNGLVPIFVLFAAQITLSFLSIKSRKARALICGRPTLLIRNGKIIESSLRREFYSVNDLLEQLRIKNVPNVSDVEFAILETNGQLSIIPKSQKRPVVPEDINIPTVYEGMAIDLIIDGKVIQENLEKISLDEEWLKKELSGFAIRDVSNVFFASIDTTGKLYFQKKGDE